MNIVPGKILISSPAMDDPHFLKSVLLITDCNADGATGFVINKVFERSLNELTEFSSSPAFPLHDGGPVDKEHLFFIHRRNDLIPGSLFKPSISKIMCRLNSGLIKISVMAPT